MNNFCVGGPFFFVLDHSRECAISPQSLRLDWVMASGPLQVAATELNHTQQALGQLAKILEQITASNNAETDVSHFLYH